MQRKKQVIPWIIFIAVSVGSYIFMLFFMEKITAEVFHVEKKKIHLEKATQAVAKIDKKADVTIDKASTTVLRDSTILENGKKKVILIDTGEEVQGSRLFLVNLFNDSRLTYSLVVTLAMAIVGILIGVLTDIILKIIGMDVSKIAHHE